MSSSRADMFITPAEDPRADPPSAGDERSVLSGFLQWHRETLQLKCAGLDAEALASRSVEPSTMSLLGLVRHMAYVERTWFRRFLAGQDVPDLFATAPDEDFDGAVADPQVVAEAWELWRTEIAFAEQFVSEVPDLDVLSHRTDRDRGRMSVRWVLVHMIEEYARHNGHADLLRERIDGALGQ